MRLQTRPLPNLVDADIIPYYWKPYVWFNWQRAWGREGQPIRGLNGRIGLIGFAISFDGLGRFHNGSRWCIFFKYRREIEEMLW